MIVDAIKRLFGKKLFSNVNRKVDRIISGSMGRQITFLAVVTLSGFVVLGLCIVAGMSFFGTGFCAEEGLWWTFAENFLDLGNFKENNYFSNNWVILFINIAGMFLVNGLLISVASNIIERRVDRVKNGRIHYHFNNHIVIAGYDTMCVGLVEQLWKRYGREVKEIVLQTVREVPGVRHELFSNLPPEIEKHVTVVSGSRTSEEDLRKLNLPGAREIYILGESGEYDHDSMNIQSLNCVAKIFRSSISVKDAEIMETDIDGLPDVSGEEKCRLRTKQDALLQEYSRERLRKCHVLFEYQSTFAVFQQQDLSKYIYLYIDVLPFNFYEMWARKVFVGGKYVVNGKVMTDNPYPSLDRGLIDAGSDRYVHFVVVACTRMGIAMAIEAAHIAHFANYRRHKTRITLIDCNAETEMNILRSRYPAFLQTVDTFLDDRKTDWSGEQGCDTDIEIHFVRGNIESPEIRRRLVEWTADSRQLLTIAICFNHPPASLAAGLYLPEEVYDAGVPVLIRTETSGAILAALENRKISRYGKVYVFGMTSDCYDMELNEDTVPQYIHYIYCHPMNFDKTGFPSKKNLAMEWKKLSVIHKWSNRYHADMIPAKLRMAGMKCVDTYETFQRLASLDEAQYDAMTPTLAEVEHNRWNVEKLLAGFRPLNAERMQKLLAAAGNETLRAGMLNLKALKNEYFRLRTEAAALEEQNRHAEAEAADAEARRLWSESIKPAKQFIEARFCHDCIAPFEQLSDSDRFSDFAITRGLKWIIKSRNRLTDTQ